MKQHSWRGGEGGREGVREGVREGMREGVKVGRCIVCTLGVYPRNILS